MSARASVDSIETTLGLRAKRGVELIAAHIHSKNAGRALLQKNLGKAAGGRACVQANAGRGRESEGVERRLQLPGAARNIAFSFKHLQRLIRRNLAAPS